MCGAASEQGKQQQPGVHRVSHCLTLHGRGCTRPQCTWWGLACQVCGEWRLRTHCQTGCGSGTRTQEHLPQVLLGHTTTKPHMGKRLEEGMDRAATHCGPPNAQSNHGARTYPDTQVVHSTKRRVTQLGTVQTSEPTKPPAPTPLAKCTHGSGRQDKEQCRTGGKSMKRQGVTTTAQGQVRVHLRRSTS